MSNKSEPVENGNFDNESEKSEEVIIQLKNEVFRNSSLK